MLSHVVTTGTQVLILFVLIGVGFVCGKIKMFSDVVISSMTAFTLYIVTPCAIIDSFCRKYDPSMLTSLLIMMATAVGIHLLNIIFGYLFIHDRNKSTERVLRFGNTFGNSGYMGFPLLNALFGSTGVFYGAAFNTVFVLFAWTYGLVLISGDKREISFRKLLYNPGIIGAVVGMVIFLCSVSLSPVVYDPIHYLSSLNVPIPMLIVGYYLSKSDLRSIWKKINYYICIFIRLIVTPLITLGILYFLNLRGTLLVCSIIYASVPVAALTTMLATRYNQDIETSTSIVSMSTLVSIVTMSLIVGFSQYLS